MKSKSTLPPASRTSTGRKTHREVSKGKNGRPRDGELMEDSQVVQHRTSWKPSAAEVVLAAVAILVSFVWAYWPTLVKMVGAWERQPDYSHGYFVVPLALYFCWARRDHFPGTSVQFAWQGLALILLSVVIRIAGVRYYVDAVDAWSMIVWIAGVVWLLGGWRVSLWASPSIGFLLFMIPLPWSAERMLSLPLQRVATKLSTWALQVLGQPAIAEGSTIWLDEYRLEVEQACSGLRIFVGIFALAFAYVVLARRTWWERGLLLLSALPIALVANSTRIVVTGLLYRWVSGDAAHKFTHDISGYVMIPYAAALFALVLWYCGHITREVQPVTAGEILHDPLFSKRGVGRDRHHPDGHRHALIDE